MLNDVVMVQGDMRVRLVREDAPDQPYHDGRSPVLRLCPLGGGGCRADYIDGIGGFPPSAIRQIVGAAGRWCRDRDLFERYLRMFHGTTAIEWYDGRCDGGDYLYVTFDTADWRRHHGLAGGSGAVDMSDWRAYCEGEVYGYAIEERATWRRASQAGAASEIMQTWELVDSRWGHYGTDYAERAARQAFRDLTIGTSAPIRAK